MGNSGRNAWHGPGAFNLDASLSRRFRLPWMSEASALGFRVDVFNLFNHANLTNPAARLGAPGFGIALRGVEQRPNAFRVLGPAGDTRRQLQLSVRLEF
jgi:hypothetical protein